MKLCLSHDVPLSGCVTSDTTAECLNKFVKVKLSPACN